MPDMTTKAQHTTRWMLLAGLMLLSGPAMVFAQQDFTLFEPVESTDQPVDAAENRVSRENRNSSSNGTPEFTLAGTSRIGDRVSAILVHRDGKTVVVRSDSPDNTIEGFTQYSVAGIEAGRVTLNYPGNAPCNNYADKGVLCNDTGNRGELTLPSTAPLAPRNPPVEAVEPVLEVASDGVDEATVNPDNPFAAIQAAAVARQRGDRGADGNPDAPPRSFQPRRIDPADVPPGMRIVSTPFGDRLVEDN